MIDRFCTYVDGMTGWQRFFSAIGVIAFCLFCTFIFICIFGIGLYIYEDVVDRINERKRMRRLRKK